MLAVVPSKTVGSCNLEMGKNAKFSVWVWFGYFEDKGSVLFGFRVLFKNLVRVRFELCKHRVRVWFGWGSSSMELERSGFPRLLESPGKSGIFFLKIPGPGKSWKITLVLDILESPGRISLKVMHFSSGSNGKQAAHFASC